MSARRLLLALRRNWYLVLAGLVLGGLVGAGAAALLPRSYQSSSLVLVSAPSLPASNDGNDYVENRMPTLAELITSRPVLDLAERSAGLASGTLTRQNVTAEVPPTTFVINLSVTASDARTAADRANAVAQAFVTLAPGLDNPRRPVLAVALIERALPRNSAPTLSPLIPVLAAMVLGLTAGILVALARTARPSRIRTEEDAAQATGSEPLAAVSWAGPGGGRGVIALGPQGPRAMRAGQSGADPFAVLFSRLRLDAGVCTAAPTGPRFVTVLSTEHRAEAAAVAVGLASTALGNGQQCLVLAVDEETHALLSGVAMPDTTGASSEPVRTGLVSRTGAVLTEAELSTTIHAVRPVPDLVVVPAPPVDQDPSARTAVRSATEVLLALPLGSAGPATARRTARAVEETGKRLAGTVLLVEERGVQERDAPAQSWE